MRRARYCFAVRVLPQVVTRRLARLGDGPVRTGMLGVGAAAALAEVGFDQVCEVIGAVALRVPPRSFFAYGTGALYTPTFPRGWQGSPDGEEPIVLTSSTQRDGRIPTSITALKSGYRDALKRLVTEVRRAGGDGAVDVDVRRTTLTEGECEIWNFLATGTAVRSRGRTRAEQPFTCALGASQVAAALRGGWMPLQFLACPVMAIRWIDPEDRKRTRARAPNSELHAYTTTVNVCRHQARTDFAAAAERAGGEGAIMSDMNLKIGRSPSVAEATVLITGTAVAGFGRHRSPKVVASLSLADDR
jgi:uncharacterized protein YbjQ (UPF0145 family)